MNVYGIAARPWAILAILIVLVLGGAWLVTATVGSGSAKAGADDDVVTVYKTPQCGCCTEWVDYLRDEGFEVEAHDVNQEELNSIKVDAGVERELASCHTAFVGDYVIEGHVPAADIRRLLEEAPDVAGISVPGMPVGSPGMEMGDRQDPYDVVTFGGAEGGEVFASHHQ